MGESVDIEFGLFLDHAPWGHGNSALGSVRLGPRGLTQLLQTRLGLGRPEAVHTRRVNQFKARLASAATPDAWFHDSWATDPWSTAVELLDARDEIVSHGWSGTVPDDASDRLRALAALEISPLPLDSASADDVVEILAELENPPAGKWPPGITSITPQHPWESFPAIWQKILLQLQRRGVILGSPPSDMAGAPSVYSLTTTTEWEAAEHAARWLASGDNSGVAVVAGTGTAVLDHALARWGLPRLGIGNPTKLRVIDQIIPLFFNVIWAPADVQLLAEFMSLPISPVRRSAARKVLHALTQQPGTGGDAWTKALAEISNSDNLGPTVAAELDELFNSSLLTEGEATGADVAERAAWLSTRLRSHLHRHPELDSCLSQLAELTALLDDSEHVSRLDIRRMLNSVLPARPSTLVTGEASHWQVVRSPVEIAGDVDTILWWGCQDEGGRHQRYWSPDEQDALAVTGVILPDPAHLAEVKTSLTVAAARRCGTLLLFRASEINGEPTRPHPVVDAVAFELGTDAVDFAVEEKSLTRGNVWQLAGRRTLMATVSPRTVEAPSAVHSAGAKPEFIPPTVSYTQLSTLIGCSMKWVLAKQARLKVADAQSVPTGNSMIGTLVHRIVEELFTELHTENLAVPTAEQVVTTLHALVPNYASELLLPGKGSKLAGLEPVIVKSVITLFSTLQKAGIAIHAMEQKIAKSLVVSVNGESKTIPMTGSIDLVASDPAGRPVVVDLKWTNHSRYKYEEVAEGQAMQLVLYQWALADMKSTEPDGAAAYYLLKQGEFASASPLFGPSLTATQTGAETWRKSVRAAEFSLSEVANGRFAAAGRDDFIAVHEPERAAAAGDRLYQKAQCSFCDFSVLCGLKGDLS